MATAQWAPPAPPDEAVREGGRWRYHRPSSEDVADWFSTQPLDEGMRHEHYVGGVVLIPQQEKVRHTSPDGRQIERYEQVFTPYVQIGTRVSYARRLAEHRGLIYVSEAADVPRATNPTSPYFNGNMVAGLWWHLATTSDGNVVRYLCATAKVALYDPTTYAAKLRGEKPLPLISGEGTKQVGGNADQNMVARAQTGAIGRALGVAGILTIGTGIATAEDLQEFAGYAATAVVPPQVPDIASNGIDPSATLEQLQDRAMALTVQMQEQAPDKYKEFSAWFAARGNNEGWHTLPEVPFESLKAVVARLERDLA